MSHLIESLESRTLLTVTLETIGTQIYPANKTIIVPVNATSDSTSDVNYSVSSSDARIKVRELNNLTFLRMQVSINGVDQGAMEFALFNDLAPNTVARITELVNSGFYDNLTFHRVIPNFMAQGGDPLGTGTGGTGVKFNDEFNPESIFSTTGQLAMANSGADTNDSQFFITVAETHHLNFRHTIFGQIVSGRDVLTKIMAVPTTGTQPQDSPTPSDKPLQPVVITDASIVQNRADTVLLVTGPLNVPGTVTVTATDHNSTASQSFSVNGETQMDASNQPVNDPPYLLPMSNLQTVNGVPVSFTIPTNDIDGGTPYVDAITLDQQKVTVARDGDRVTVTPVAGFTGTAEILVGVSRGTSWDTERLEVQVLPGPFAKYDATTRVLTVDATSMADTILLSVEGDLLRASLNGQVLTFGLIHVASVKVNMGAGNDSLTVGAGAPAVEAIAGDGDDYVFGSDLNDTLRGGPGNDTLHGADGNDVIGGGDGHDLLGGQRGWDTFTGGLGRDTIRGGDNGDLIYGGNAGDSLAGGRGLDTLYGDANNDSLDGQDGADLLNGGDGDDTLVGGFGVDNAYGNSGNDVFYTADDVPDYVFGGIGDDTAYRDLLDVVAAESVIDD